MSRSSLTTNWEARPDLLAGLDLVRIGLGRYRAPSVPAQERRVVFGGQLLAQSLLAAHSADTEKQVRQIHTTFARTGAPELPVELEVDLLHMGRALSSVSVTAHQNDRPLCRSLILLDVGEPDLFRQSAIAPSVAGPAGLPDLTWAEAGSVVRLADPSVDLDVTAPNGPAELSVWVAWPRVASVPAATHQAIASWYTDPFLIGASMRPHDGVSIAMAHTSISTGVVSHTLTFHEPFPVDEWHLIWQEVAFAGGGRVHGRGEVFTAGWRHVASFIQEAVVRRQPPKEELR